MYPNTSLQPGATGPAVAQLQQFLLSQGLLTQSQIDTGPGIYGPQTTAAVKAWQQANGVDNASGPGYWGPRSIAKASQIGGGSTQQPGEEEPVWMAEAREKAATDARFKGNSLQSLEEAVNTGNFSGIYNEFGQPFSDQEQRDALEQGMKDNELYYKALGEKDKADTQAAIAQKQADYQDYLLTSGQSFEQDKTTADQSAANSGVLFSGGRVQKEKNLERAYTQDQASKFGSMSNDISSLARDYQYNYGNDAAKGLSKYYKLGGNSYNANVARGGVGNQSLSRVYNPRDYNFQGTVNTERLANANKRAAGLLWNKGNQLLGSGYTNSYN